MNNPIIVPMTVSASDTNVPMTLSSDDRTFGMGMDSAVFIAPVKGVKGDAETDYRTGYVNLTADDIGVDTSEFALRSELPTATSDLTNDSGFIDGSQVPSNETDPTRLRKSTLSPIPQLFRLLLPIWSTIADLLSGQMCHRTRPTQLFRPGQRLLPSRPIPLRKWVRCQTQL